MLRLRGTPVLTPKTTARIAQEPRQARLLPGSADRPHPGIRATTWFANSAEGTLILERSHHEVAGAGQQEINYRFNSLSTQAMT